MKHSMKLLVVRLVVLAGLFVAAQVMAATVPKTLNYQGTLTDINGNLIDGNRDITVKLYTVNSGGTPFWSKTQNGISVIKGNFSFVIGDDLNPLDPTLFTDEMYIGITVGTDPEMDPRQQLTSVAYALKSGDSVPAGGIIMWSGAINTIPEGWALCDGTNGTPNLRDRFIIGAGNGYAVGATGGETTHTLTTSEMPIHTHTQNAHNHYDAGHQHVSASSGFPALAPIPQPGGGYSRNSGSGYVADVGNGYANIQNNTATNQNSGGGAAHNNLPPYYALAFIMKRH